MWHKGRHCGRYCERRRHRARVGAAPCGRPRRVAPRRIQQCYLITRLGVNANCPRAQPCRTRNGPLYQHIETSCIRFKGPRGPIRNARRGCTPSALLHTYYTALLAGASTAVQLPAKSSLSRTAPDLLPNRQCALALHTRCARAHPCPGRVLPRSDFPLPTFSLFLPVPVSGSPCLHPAPHPLRTCSLKSMSDPHSS